jgi:hypothetical protein
VIQAGRRRGRIRSHYVVRAVPPIAPVTELAFAAGHRIRFSPIPQVGGWRLQVAASGLGRRGTLVLQLSGAAATSLRASSQGVVQGAVDVPGTAHAGNVHLRARGRSSSVPLALLLPDPSIAGAGDIACGAASTSSQCEQMATSDLLLRLAPQAVLALGDTQYEVGQLGDFTRFYNPSWGRLKSITYPVVGNHEYGDSDPATCGYACGYFDYFDGVGSTTGRAGQRGEGFYAFDIGAWRLYAMNSNCNRTGAPSCAVGSPQEAWLRSDLAAHPTQCALMFLHHPLFTSDTRNFDDPKFQAALRPLWQAFYDAGGDVVLTGHSHFYERFAPQNPFEQADPARGIRQFIVGTGGRNTYEFGAIEPTSEVRIGRTFGVLKLTLHPASYDWSFVTIPAGTVADSGSQPCH